MTSPGNSEIMEGGVQTNKTHPVQREPLLRAKFYIPPIRSNHIARPRLINLINHGLDRALTLISAPAGYGKTTLVSSWLKDIHVSSTWLSLDADDNDPILFLQNFLAALHKIFPALQPDLLSVFQGMKPDPFGALLNFLMNEIAASATYFVFVIDDFHVIHAQPILDMLNSLLEHVLPQLHLVLISRIDPPLPLFRLRARDQLVEIRAEQLQFTKEEISAFLNDGMDLRLSDDDVAALEIRTEGWIAGLQLAGLSMQSSKDIHSFISEFTGSHHYIMDYLTEEVLRLQPEWLSLFLLQTSILSSMCGSLCEAVVDKGEAEPVNGQTMLEDLEQMNLFVVPLDDKRQWYRYHHLFADVLNRRLEHLFPQILPVLHQRASLWYEHNGYVTEAIQHALLAGDKARMVHMIEQNGCNLLMRGEVTTLARWMTTLESETPSHPWLSVLKAWTLTLTGNLERVEHILQSAEQQLSPLAHTPEIQIVLGTAAAARAHNANAQGNIRLASDSARQALELLPDDNAFSCVIRSVATSILGDASWIGGDLDEAQRIYTQAVSIGVTADDIYSTMIASVDLADIQMEQGQLHKATRTYAEILRMASGPDRQEPPLVNRAYVGKGRVFYEWNQLDAAEQHLRQCMRLGQQWGDQGSQVAGCVMLAWLELARCHREKAQEMIHLAEKLVADASFGFRLASWVNYALARLWLTQGDIVKARQLIPQCSLAFDDEIPYPQEPAYLLKLRILLTEGDYAAALTLSERLLRQAEKTNRLARIIELLNLQALAYQGGKETDQALAALERAISLAQPEGYLRVFLDEGEALAKLLYQVRARHVEARYVTQLLAAISSVPSQPQPPAHSLIEPLSARELEVLRLIAAGHSNQEIAVKLVISDKTVKRHISNIYDKLAAKNRTQALSLAREVGLLS